MSTIPLAKGFSEKRLKFPVFLSHKIVGVEEAIDQNGNPKGMAGGLVASYKGTKIGIGPGRLTHAERTTMWVHAQTGMFHKRMAQIKYKADDSYDALRQPTFQFWRDDKDEPDA